MNLLPRIILPVVVLASLAQAATAAADEASASAPAATSAPAQAFASEEPDPNAAWTRPVALRVGVVAAIVGGVAVPAGAFVFVAGNLHCEDADCRDPVKKGVGIAMMVGGSAALVGGAVILATMPKATEPTRHAAQLTVRPGGADFRLTF